MSNMPFDGNACIDAVESAWVKFCAIDDEVRGITGDAARTRGAKEASGVGFALKRVLVMARDFLALCPIQPGQQVRVTGGTWTQRGRIAVGEILPVVAVDWQESRDGQPGRYVIQVRQSERLVEGAYPYTEPPHLYTLLLTECEVVPGDGS